MGVQDDKSQMTSASAINLLILSFQ